MDWRIWGRSHIAMYGLDVVKTSRIDIIFKKSVHSLDFYISSYVFLICGSIERKAWLMIVLAKTLALADRHDWHPAKCYCSSQPVPNIDCSTLTPPKSGSHIIMICKHVSMILSIAGLLNLNYFLQTSCASDLAKEDGSHDESSHGEPCNLVQLCQIGWILLMAEIRLTSL